MHTEWTEAFAGILSTVGDWFRLPASTCVRADFHSLLVYQPGQFFLPHQDSEKHDGMIGTLVVTLPSSYTGGELVIHHGGESRTHRALKSELALVAFHADRRHEVRPVKSGHRVALTYNLILDGKTDVPMHDDGADVEELAGCLREHFVTGARHPYRPETGPPPTRVSGLWQGRTQCYPHETGSSSDVRPS